MASTDESDYMAEHLTSLESSLTSAVNDAIDERADDPLAHIILSLAALREAKLASSTDSADPKSSASSEQLSVLAIMDPGQDLDDEMFMVLLRALADRNLATCVGVVTTMEPSVMRAQLARGTLDVLGLRDVPVGAGSSGNAKGSTKAMEDLAYVGGLGGYDHLHGCNDGMELMVNVLRAAAPKSITFVVIASLADAASLLRAHEDLFVHAVKEVVIQGGVQPFTPGVAQEDDYLVPDTAHNNEFDREASEFVYLRCQQLGVPLLVVSRFAAGGCQVPRAIYDEMAATGSPIGLHLQKTQATSIERLWRQACAPVGSEPRGGLPPRCDKAWFCSTFCAGAGTERSGDESIWDCVVSFNMYDPLALLAALPSLRECFDFTELTVNGTVHRVVGTSKEASGVRPDEGVGKYMYQAFLDGITGEARERERAKVEAKVAAATIAALRSELEALRAKRP